MTTFTDLGLKEDLLQAIADLGFSQPTEIQEKVIPVLLTKERDLVALAQTGTGKTAAFGFPILQNIDSNNRTTQGLILSPTRELCLQITNEIKLYGKHCKGLNVVAIYGGASITEQAKQIERGAQIVVATPGRMKDMIKRKLVNISKLQYSILDEADEMLNMGFYEDIADILSYSPKEKSTWLFSATMPKEVVVIAKKFMNNPIEITVGKKNESTSQVSHEYYLVNARDRYLALKSLSDANPDIFSVVFCRTKRDTQKIAEKLIEDGYSAGALHGDLSQNQRDMVMKAFRNKQIQMLVATDVAARGIDVDDITHVINYQLPDEIETYTHRSGRTGRAGKTGVSMVIVSKSEIRKLKAIERIIKKQFQHKTMPSGIDICAIQLLHLANKVHHTEISHDIDDYLDNINAIFKDTNKEELIKKFFSVEFSRFNNYYKNTKNLTVTDSDSKSSHQKKPNNETRFFINVGRKDGFDWMSLKDFLKANLELDRNEVFKVDVMESFSFFNTDVALQTKILDFFTDFKHEGRFVNVEISDNKSGKSKRKNPRDRRKTQYGNTPKSKTRYNDSNNTDKKQYNKSSFKSDRPRRSRRH